MNILFCGGGTGGHISPAIAIAEYILENEKDVNLAFVGRKGGEENQPIVSRDFKLFEIDISPIPRKISLKSAKAVISTALSIGKARKIIKRFSPDAVIATGGYVSFPMLITAKGMKIPIFIHETNAYPGLVTRMMSRRADKVLLNVSEAREHLKRQDNIALVGNPVRKEFYKRDRHEARAKLNIGNADFLIVSFGGSGGSEKLNETIKEFIYRYSIKYDRIKHIHASGRKYYKEFSESEIKRYKRNGVQIRSYIDNMPTMLAAADLVISRAGAMSISELEASGCVSILIPSPNVTNNHQFLNAENLRLKNAALVIEENELNADKLIDTVEKIRKNRHHQLTLRENISKEAKENSAELIFKEIKSSFILPQINT